MPQLIFFRQTDELATPLPIEEQGDAWWAGVQRCFAAVPIAAAAAVALSASLAFGAQQQTDDIVPQPQAALDDGYYQVVAPPPAPPRFLYLPDPEEIPAGSLRATAEEDYWWSPSTTNSAPVPQPRTVDDDLPVAVALDDTSWSPPAPLVQLSASQPWADDDTLPPTTAAALDDGAWFPTVVVSTSPALPTLPWDDQAVPAAPVAAPPEEDLWQVSTPGPLPPRFLYLPDPEALPGALAGAVDEDAWSPAWSVKATALGQLWTVPDELPITPTTPVETDPWSPALVVQPPSSTAVWTAQDETITPLRVDELYSWQAYSIPAAVVASAWIIDIENFAPPLFPPPAGGFTFKEIRTERGFAIAARRREFIATSSGRIFVVPKQGAGA